MPKLTKHPGVSIQRPRKVGYPIHLVWKHPLLGAKQVGRTIHTTDTALAVEYARKLSALLSSPNDWHKQPDYISDPLWTCWQGEIVEDAAAAAVAKTARHAVNSTHGVGIPVFVQSGPNGPRQLYVADPQSLVGKRIRKKIRETAQVAVDTAASQAKENKALRDKVASLEAKVKGRDAMIRRLGHDIAEDYRPKPIRDAISDYCSTDINKRGTNACERTLQSVRSKLARFADSLSPDIMVGEVTAAHVIAYIAAMADGNYVKIPEDLKTDVERTAHRASNRPGRDHLRLIGVYVCACLTHQTNGTFKAFPVKEWLRKHNSVDKDAEPANPYWLDQRDVDNLCRNLPAYWAEAARVQWAGGFRPEELTALQSKNVTTNGDVRIEVTRIMDGNNVVWTAKTKQSYGKVHIPEFARKTVQKLLRRKSFLLFPNDLALHKGREPRYKTGRDFQKRNKLWTPKYFCEQYIKQLRAAAEKAKLDVGRIDSRTLRRSCGKRILLASKFDVNLAAAVLRDQAKTITKYYAKIIPDDVRQPE